MSDLIRIENLTKDYLNDGVATPVLHGVSFTVPKGQFLAESCLELAQLSQQGWSQLLYLPKTLYFYLPF
jgi:alpha-D-ribose 1-methylphosphonate 5-triphosphate synthase subunit PhnL